MDGLILVDKPQNFTSHDIVLETRNILNIKKVGHCGTLDPLATGLMLLALGKATRLFPFLSKWDLPPIPTILLENPLKRKIKIILSGTIF
jgi:tRNA pseudouridine(55) synthase